MKTFLYRGSKRQFDDQPCVVTHYFYPNNTKRPINQNNLYIDPAVKYTVKFGDKSTVNVYGCNIEPIEEVTEFKTVGHKRKFSNFVLVQFKGSSKNYHYLNPGIKLKVGDYVAVEALNTISLAMVTCLSNTDEYNYANKYVVQRINTTKIDKIRKRQARIKGLKVLIETRIKLLKERIVQAELSESDDELKSMVEELAKLEKQND